MQRRVAMNLRFGSYYELHFTKSWKSFICATVILLSKAEKESFVQLQKRIYYKRHISVTQNTKRSNL